jgi:hypothetical protein
MGKIFICFFDVHGDGKDQKCNDKESKDILSFFRNTIFPHYRSTGKYMDLFVEQILFYRHSETTITSLNEEYQKKELDALTSMRLLLNQCPPSVRCHTIDVRGEELSILFKLREINDNFFSVMYDPSIDPTDIIGYHSQAIKNNFDNMISVINQIISIYDYHFFREKSIKIEEGLIQNKLFNKIYGKLLEADKEFFIEINIKYFKIWEQYIKQLEIFKKTYSANPGQMYIDYTNGTQLQSELYKKRNDILITHTIPAINNFYEACDHLISVTSFLLDIYTIGRLLKPYASTSFIYAGAAHCQNIIRELTTSKFKIINQCHDYTKITDEYIETNYHNLYCVDIKNLELY